MYSDQNTLPELQTLLLYSFVLLELKLLLVPLLTTCPDAVFEGGQGTSSLYEEQKHLCCGVYGSKASL